jgi:5S rRNA maturation endonuclease (ribonuclease M5)
MSDDIFSQARALISKNLIERLITGEWIGDNYEFCSPFRIDKNPSIHMTDNGLWIDRSTQDKGDLIDFLCRRDGLTKKQAAEKIIEMSGGTIPEKKSDKKKISAVIPFDESNLQLLKTHVVSKYISDKYGEAVKAWTYRNYDGKPWICTVRFEKDNKKDVVPFYFGDDNKFHAGNPVRDRRQLFNIDKLKKDLPVLIVEGEKCGSVIVDGYNVISWIGGVGQVEKSEWNDLRDYSNIIIFPDNDIPGYKAAEYIKSVLPQAKILKINNKPEKWDIYDAQKEGIDLLKFIEECEIYEVEKETFGNTDKYNTQNGNETERYKNEIIPEISSTITAPFLFLGHNEQSHFFLPKGSNIIKKISFGSFNKTKLLELAPLSYWCMEFPDKGGFSFDSACDWLIRCSEIQGFFFPDRIRGTGVWIDKEKIIVNDGDVLKDHSGQIIRDIKSNYFYVKSEKRMGEFTGEQSTDEQGKSLIKLFVAQNFQSKLEAAHAVGWSMIAPFGGILTWRPHLWITGPKGCGKSFCLENIIEPLCRPYIHRGSGKDSSPGIYRSLRNTPMPVILDEMEPGNANNKDAKLRIEEKLELARNASSDFSANITLTNKDGQGETFCTRSCFCCSSIVPHMMGEAIESRFLLSRMNNFGDNKLKVQQTKELLSTGIMIDPEIYKRRMFYNLDIFLKNLQIIKEILYSEMPNRKADNYAPVFASILLLTDLNIITSGDTKKIRDWIFDDMMKDEHIKEDISDEDILLRALFDSTIRDSSNETISIAELINDGSINFINEEKNLLLKRNGIAKYTSTGQHSTPAGDYIAVATAHGSIRDILKETMYADRYVSVLERHKAAISEKPMIRFAGQSKRAVLLKWDVVRAMYFDENLGESVVDADFNIPF